MAEPTTQWDFGASTEMGVAVASPDQLGQSFGLVGLQTTTGSPPSMVIAQDNGEAVELYQDPQQADKVYLKGSFGIDHLDVSGAGWVFSGVFSVTDADTIAWGAGTLTTEDGDAYAIGASNTGNMAAKTYIYFDVATSEVAFQLTTTASTAVGAGKILIAVAQNGTGEAKYMVMNDNQYNIDAANIVANSITANELATSIVYAGSIVIDTAGLIRSGMTAYMTGTGWWLGNDGGTPKFSIGDSTEWYLSWDGVRLRIREGFYTFLSYFVDPADMANTSAGGKWVEQGAPNVNYYYTMMAASTSDMSGSVEWGVSSASVGGIYPIALLTMATTKLVTVEVQARFKGAGVAGGFAGAGFGFSNAGTSTYDGNQLTQMAGFVLDPANGGALYTRTGSTAGNVTTTAVASAPTLTDLNTYRIEYDLGNATPQIRFYVNDTLKNTHTTTLPSTGNLVFAVGSDNAGSADLAIDVVTAPVFQIEK